MTQAERRLFLIRSLMNEKTEYADLGVPRDADGQRQLLRGLINVRLPAPADEEFLAVQDAYLQRMSGSSGIFRILRRNTALATCIPAGSTRSRRGRSSGRIGAAISSSTAIRTRRSRCMTSCWSWCGTRTISSSRRTLTTSFRRPDLTKSVCSTRRVTTACSSAASPAVRRPLITRP